MSGARLVPLRLAALVGALVAALTASLAACAGDEVSVAVRIEIPADVPSIEAGTVHLQLWQYDPLVQNEPTGVPPSPLVDQSSQSFRHRAGQSTVLFMGVSGRIAARHRYFVSADGCVPSPAGEVTILWDGIEDITRLPREIRMRPRPGGGDCASRQTGTSGGGPPD